MQAGKFITFEGIDGSGKTTQIEYLADYLESIGLRTTLLREPGGTKIGEEIRRILLDMRNQGMTVETELFLFESARAQLVREVIRPSLERGIWVISDRFHDSSVAYQGYGRGLPIDMVQALNNWAIGETRPDLTILLELGLEARSMRLGKRQDSGHKDRFDVESDAFKQRVCSGFHAIAKEEPARVIRVESQEQMEETAKLIREQVRRNLL
ncbi:MAG TPA: dTMP kinase [Clostridia bacterium]|nr:dTMP kinase [Clostridia bacterium]